MKGLKSTLLALVLSTIGCVSIPNTPTQGDIKRTFSYEIGNTSRSLIYLETSDGNVGELYGEIYNLDGNGEREKHPLLSYKTKFEKKGDGNEEGNTHFESKIDFDCGTQPIKKLEEIPERLEDFKPDGIVDYSTSNEFNGDFPEIFRNGTIEEILEHYIKKNRPRVKVEFKFFGIIPRKPIPQQLIPKPKEKFA